MSIQVGKHGDLISTRSVRRPGTKGKMPLPALISYGEFVFRPAGYRTPLPGEHYVAKDGHIKCYRNGMEIPQYQALIVRLYDAEKDFNNK